MYVGMHTRKCGFLYEIRGHWVQLTGAVYQEKRR